eukprot:scaffold33848_cov139-Isochrysis_galbana.AAC.2
MRCRRFVVERVCAVHSAGVQPSGHKLYGTFIRPLTPHARAPVPSSPSKYAFSPATNGLAASSVYSL